MFLLGEFQNRIDPRGRAFVPAKFRDQLGSPIYMVMDDRKCIECYNEEGIRAKYEECLSRNDGLLSTKTVKARLFSSGDTQPVDTQGRIILKPDYLSAIGADKDVVFLGVGDHFEIWSKDGYDSMKEKINERTGSVSDIDDLEEELRILRKRKELLREKKEIMAELEEI